MKVFGRRPSQAVGLGTGRRTETAQARTRGPLVRRYGDLEISLRVWRWRGECKVVMESGAGVSGRGASVRMTRRDDVDLAELAVIRVGGELVVDGSVQAPDGRSTTASTVS